MNAGTVAQLAAAPPCAVAMACGAAANDPLEVVEPPELVDEPDPLLELDELVELPLPASDDAMVPLPPLQLARRMRTAK